MYTATPARTSATPAPRLVAIFDAGAPHCPRCGYDLSIVSGVSLREGWQLARCPRKRQGHRCGQAMMLLAVSGVCVVVALTPSEFDAAETAERAPQLLADLRVLGIPLVACES